MMPKSGEGATACLRMWAGTHDAQNKYTLFFYAGLNISRQTEGTNAHRPLNHQQTLAGPHLHPRRDVQPWLTALSHPEHSVCPLGAEGRQQGARSSSSTSRAPSQLSAA